jgi:hypothetical protein
MMISRRQFLYGAGVITGLAVFRLWPWRRSAVAEPMTAPETAVPTTIPMLVGAMKPGGFDLYLPMVRGEDGC